MKQVLFILSFGLLLTACGESSFERNTDADAVNANDTATGFQVGQGTDANSNAAPNAANTTNTPVPLDTVVVDTTKE